MLKHKAAIVTEPTSGIDQGVAEGLARFGCSVMLNGFADLETIENMRAKLATIDKADVRYSLVGMTQPSEYRPDFEIASIL